jgi:hypothetical protein
MNVTFPRLLPLVLALLAACLLAPAAAHAFTIGVSDQKTGMWQDPRFEQLGIRQVRLLVSYDLVLKGDFSRYDRWMATAHARGADVLLTINQHHSGSASARPTLRQYRRIVRTLRKRYPWVTTMAAWNEANHKHQPLYKRPKLAARYYNVMREECGGCDIVAADVLDTSNMLPWIATFKRYARNAHIWGLHSYGDTNRFKPLSATATRQLLRAVRGDVWLTETGGIVRFDERWPGGRSGERRAARAVKRTFDVARISPRVKRVYLYHWDADRRFVTWDSAFVAANGRARPALSVLRREVNRQRRKALEPLVPALRTFPRRKLPLAF